MGTRRKFDLRASFAMVPTEIMQSHAWHFIPHFARSVVTALASKYRGKKGSEYTNNGRLFLTEQEAIAFGINKQERMAGLVLAVKVGLIKETVPAFHPGTRQGKGRCAMFALTWEATCDAEVHGYYMAAEAATREFERFKPDRPNLKSLNKAQEYLGWRKLRRSNLFS